ncbi:MAG TPA: hypothetical protein ENO02_01090 [Epsilonproteobacteria bacterium]|nr:hypothetical protein [Campylobacterota bacterium]
MELKHKLDRFTKVAIKRRKKVLKWLANQNEEIALLAFESQKEHLFNLSGTNEENRSILYLAALYLAADHLYSLYHAQNSKNRDMNINAVQGVTRMQAKKFKKNMQSEKYDKMLNLKSKILVLKDEEKLSFREISEFLKRYHRLEVSHSYVATFYHAMKEKK